MKSIQCSQMPMKICSLCNKSSIAEGVSLVHFGEWMTKKEITVHYYCLLLSTHLPQRGKDHSGILGFLLRDIRHEIAMAKHRKCMYCLELSATIQCAKCEKYFHLTCGHTSKCLSHFVGEFKSYCHHCIPVDRNLSKIFSHKPPKATELCFICTQTMGARPEGWIYGKCCGNGFTHSLCMKTYALSAGYYLKCIWCKDKRFREDIKYLGVFVPDRDANWEREKGAYGDLYQRHKRCDMEVCNCPKGRNFSNAFKWQLVICKLCGTFGAHNPACVPGFEDSKEKLLEFKCDVCAVTENTLITRNILDTAQNFLNTSLYVIKDTTETEPKINYSQGCSNTNNSFDIGLSQGNHCNKQTVQAVSSSKAETELENVQLSSTIYTLTQSPQTSQHLTGAEPDLTKIQQEEYSDEENTIVDLLVQKMLDTINAYMSKNS